jgi:hypothetical protein
VRPTGAAADAAPIGAFERLEITLNERVAPVTVADVDADPSFAFDLVHDGALLTLTPLADLDPGRYRVTLSADISDLSGNRLDGDRDGVGGDPHVIELLLVGRDFQPTGADGTPRTGFELGEPIFAAGSGLPGGAALDLYLIVEDEPAAGLALTDRTGDGATTATPALDGTLPPTSLGVPGQAGEYSLVADLDRDGVFDEGTDRFWRPGGIGVVVFEDGDEPACAPGATTLCLNGGRFEVEASWSTVHGTSGPGRAVPLTDDTGFFWFFDSDNVELAVKALDACPVNGHLWIFAAGLTDVAVDLRVRDTVSGLERSYTNVQGTAFRPVLDTAAFAACPAGSTAATSGSNPAAGTDRGLLQAARLGAIGRAASDEPPALFLNDGRFRVEAAWETQFGTSGFGEAVALTGIDDTGYFWFFDSENVELVVKVLDACPVNGHFWVFAGGLTDVEVVLTVTDTLSGAQRTYRNPQQTPFEPIQSTDAFATCP